MFFNIKPLQKTIINQPAEKKGFRKSPFIFLVVFLIIQILTGALYLSKLQKAQAADCGDGVGACSCGDTVVADHTLTGDLNCDEDGLIIGADGITINGNGHTLTGDGDINDYGIYNNDYDYATTTNLIITNFSAGVYFSNTSSSTIQNITANSNTYGIYLSSSDSNILTNNTTNSNSSYGIYIIGANNTLTSNVANNNSNSGIGFISGNYNTLTNNTTNSNSSYGIYIGSTDNTLTNNTTNSNSSHGIYINGANNTLTSNTISLNVRGIHIGSTDNILTGNTVSSNSSYGIYIGSTDNILTGNTVSLSTYGIYPIASLNTFEQNIFSNNRYSIYNSGATNTYTSNQFLHNSTSTTLAFPEIDRIVNINDTVNFTLIMKDPQGTACSNCTYSVTTNPYETVGVSKTDNTLTGYFSPNKNGLYTLDVRITDTNSNVTKRNFVFLVGDTTSSTIRYYLRDDNTTHGQPFPLAGDDAHSMLFAPPSETEDWFCVTWIQNSPDELPNYPLANLDSVDIHSWYKQSRSSGAYIGIERFVTYSKTVDQSVSVLAVADYTENTSSFNSTNWMMDYQTNWYWLAAKLRGNNPYWRSTPDLPSYTDFTYTYSINPAVKSTSNDNLIILSATKDSDDDASLVLENPISSATTTDIVLDYFNRPFSGVTTSITSASSTSFTSPSVSTSTTTTIESVNMEITPDSDSVDLSLTTWNTSGDYSKEWTETSSASPTVSHTVGDLSLSTYYTVWYTKDGEDQARLTTLEANSSGEISFDYDQGFSTVT
ncbi:right-handed parallel beta-helix repeat-containing protein, partial [Patescibacteria group bacterium]|nr:right-handed parallel beta-helix repeat-containing protein [Patescibacteria group bacterium]